MVLRLSAWGIFLLGAVGLLIHSTLLQTGHIRAGMFCFYTNLSNLLVLVYELAGPTLTKIATDCRWRDPSRGTHQRPCGEQAGRSCIKGCFLSKCHAIIDERCYFLYTEHSATGTIFLLCHRLAITGKG